MGELLPVEDILEFLIDRVLAGGGVVLKVGYDLRNINPVVRDRIGVVLFYQTEKACAFDTVMFLGTGLHVQPLVVLLFQCELR